MEEKMLKFFVLVIVIYIIRLIPELLNTVKSR